MHFDHVYNKISCVDFSTWVHEFSERADTITQLYVDRDWWQIQILFDEPINITISYPKTITGKIRSIKQFIENTNRILKKGYDCKRIIVKARYKNLPYGSIVLYYQPSNPRKIRIEWIFRFPIYQV